MSEFVDAHHHIWRQADLPWLIGSMQPRIFGPYEPIRRDYPIEEYLADPKAFGRIYREVVGPHYPAMAVVQVVRLVEKAARVEIEATAVVPL